MLALDRVDALGAGSALAVEKPEEKKIEPLPLVNDGAVSVKVSGPRTWDLEQLNLAIGNINDATAALEKVGQLINSLEGFRQQITAPSVTPRQCALLETEAASVSAELKKTIVHESLIQFGSIDINLNPSEAIPDKCKLELAQKATGVLKVNIENKRSNLNRELAVLETAHLNSESSHSDLRDLDSALSLVTKTRKAVLDSPSHAVDACGALGVRARSLLLNE